MMNRQKSFAEGQNALYLVPTPIGNLDEFSTRAVDILKQVDVIACEDTRTSGQLLKYFDIHKRLIACHNFNEEASASGIVELLKEGNQVALISDAGYPLINDPGQKVVKAVSEAGFPVIPVSGPSAFLNALIASGEIVQPFIFVGFLPQSHGERIRKLQMYREYPMTLIFYEAPHRITKCLQDCQEVFGDRHMCLAREITKVHEEFIRGNISEILTITEELKGEMVIVMEGYRDDQPVDMNAILDMVHQSMMSGMSTRDAIKDVSARTGISKNKLYDLVNRERS